MNSAFTRQPANEAFRQTSFLDSTNAYYVEELQARFAKDPTSVGPEWRDFFNQLGDNVRDVEKVASRKGVDWPVPLHGDQAAVLDGNWHQTDVPAKAEPEAIAELTVSPEFAPRDTARALALTRSYRTRGHLSADVDPLKLNPRARDSELDPSSYGFDEADLDRQVFVDGVMGFEAASVRQLVSALRSAYCEKVGFEYMHIADPARRGWVQRYAEGRRSEPDKAKKRTILQTLVEVTGFERFLGKKFVGTTRFGIDGAETTIVALEEIIERGAELGVTEVVLGMAHRGRLNVLGQVIRKPHQAIFSEFKGGSSFPDDVEGSGDVKYHLGTSSDRVVQGRKMHLSLVANPSHLEVIDPVVLGKVRAKQEQRGDAVERSGLMPLLIHGDAAFAGQGIVAESLGLSGLKGFRTGGSVHLIINNQVGFTTDPSYARSSPYPSDVAKAVDAPIFHVNGDDPEAVAWVARLAVEYRQTFHLPVVIDLMCFRLYGHNEGDEPSFTQPAMYREIRSHRSTLSLYAQRLAAEGILAEAEVDAASATWSAHLETELETSKSYRPNKGDWLDGRWAGLERGDPEREDFSESTGVDLAALREVGRAITALPDRFAAHPTIIRFLDARGKAVESGRDLDWATAEALAMGSLAREGHPVRLSGQDSERGTFSQRHSVIIDQETGERYLPLSHVSADQAPCETFNSMLSEVAVLGFEYGYSLAEPHCLVMWEAQFGDFANGAQVIFDQFLSSAERKWLRMSGLVCLLPHGYDGQGPEHSSARLERYLQSSAEGNWQVANCTTPANYFHLLRRQIARPFRKPLILMTPKSLLRHKRCRSDLSDFGPGSSFRRILRDDAEGNGDLVEVSSVRRVLVCSGKIYFDLEAERRKRAVSDVYILRLEQLYPFPAKALALELNRFGDAEIWWCQEEPKNMGAWSFVEPYVEWSSGQGRGVALRPSYVGRPASASTATGHMSRHAAELQAIMDEAFAV
ncbi:2-oxoglutarate dehydrogenase E1 component [Rhizobium leguminosarum]|uniref:2-oxoglutarate dehydrogenase E1 component n=1 Tax=Rhizobium ruizarguesonis TaxID=2081791 RepID=UPI00102FEB61|nr:2-oxoglutarate dehydrogenase E1 component [Rhizobium ruizarguesonis]NEJ84558.1 2-oxoglutarate dehydrogenase E1 component [Rhizobium ruizarguesonis]TBC70765.1 2-oxoglutarate dehydrogenase E1 component [Rhizobium ruizarguesonis]TBE38906.1 2-oxoglutarate dehydrogenase E1 component [Rhizobium ruizarguesonis]